MSQQNVCFIVSPAVTVKQGVRQEIRTRKAVRPRRLNPEDNVPDAPFASRLISLKFTKRL
jgi:hypothetical protein